MFTENVCYEKKLYIDFNFCTNTSLSFNPIFHENFDIPWYTISTHFQILTM